MNHKINQYQKCDVEWKSQTIKSTIGIIPFIESSKVGKISL
jgi:hypothetical protein